MEKIKNLLSGHSSDDKNSAGTSSYDAGISEASTDQEGRRLSTGAGIGDHHSASHSGQGTHLASVAGGHTSGQQNYPGLTQDTRHTAPVENTGAGHGAGGVLRSSVAANTTPGSANEKHERSFPLSSNTTSATGAHTSNTTSGQNLGHDTATLGARAAMGEGIQHHRDNDRAVGADRTGIVGTGTSQESGSTGLGSYGTAQGPHSTHTANLLDPALNRGAGHEDAVHHSKVHGGGAEEADHHHSPTVTSSKGNLERDAALGAGAGAVGISEHERNKNHNAALGSSNTRAPVTSSGLTGTTETSHNQHNHHREAAIASGLGAAGGAYVVDNHLKSDNHGTNLGNSGTSTISGQNTAGTGAQSNIDRKADPSVESGSGRHLGRDAALVGSVGGAQPNTERKADPTIDSGKGHHLGRDAALAGSTGGALSNTERKADPTVESGRDHDHGRDAALVGSAGAVGAAAYQVEQHKHDKDLTEAEREAKKQHKHAEKEAKKDHHHEKEPEKERKGSILSFLHRDKSKKYSAEEDAEFDRQEKEHHSSNAGRNTAVAGGAVGGAAAYEAKKHHEASDSSSKPHKRDIGDILHGEERNRGVTGSSGFPGTEGFGDGHLPDADRDWKDSEDSSKTRGPLPLDQKPIGKDIGDHLHGDRNRGVPGESGIPGTEGFGSGVGTGPNHVTSEATVDQTGRPLPTDNTYTTGSGNTSSTHNRGHSSGVGSGTKATSSSQYDNSSAQGLGKTGGASHIGSGTTSDSHVPASSTARGDMVGEGRHEIDSNTGVANAEKNAGNTY